MPQPKRVSGWLPMLAAVVAVLTALAAPLLVSAQDLQGASLSVKPTSVTAGNTITVAGGGLEPLGDHRVVLQGVGLVVDLGSVRADPEGRFAQELEIPAHVPSGSYRVQVIGDGSPTASIAVSGTWSGGVTDTASTAAASIPVGQQPPRSLLAVLGSAFVIVLAGVVVAWRAERGLRAAQVRPRT